MKFHHHDLATRGRTKRMQAGGRMASVVSATSCARRRVIRSVGPHERKLNTYEYYSRNHTKHQSRFPTTPSHLRVYRWDSCCVCVLPCSSRRRNCCHRLYSSDVWRTGSSVFPSRSNVSSNHPCVAGIPQRLNRVEAAGLPWPI